MSLHPKLFKFFDHTGKPQKHISLIYNSLHNKSTFIKNNLMTKWEVDTGTTLSESQWQRVIRSVYNFTHCVTHWEVSLKINVRWYLSSEIVP